MSEIMIEATNSYIINLLLLLHILIMKTFQSHCYK